MTDSITIIKPFDAHRHLRDGTMLQAVAPFAREHFWGGIVMPNLLPPVVTAADAVTYRERIEAACEHDFSPLMTLYLTDETKPDDVAYAFENGIAVAVKLYPLHGTTNSALAVTDYNRVQNVLAVMEQIGMPLLIHPELPH